MNMPLLEKERNRLHKYLSKEQQDNSLAVIIKNLQTIHNFSPQEIIDLFKEKPSDKIPVSIFNKKLGCLESIVKYLKENKELKYNEIARLLNRDQRTIWTTYQKAKKKLKTLLPVNSEFFIPIKEISSRKYAVLESITRYLKDYLHLPLHQIASLLERDQRTIWTTYQRAKRKR